MDGQLMVVFPSQPPQPSAARYGTFRAIVDADTLAVDLHESPEIVVRTHVRLAGLDAPSVATDAGRAAVAWVREWLMRHGVIMTTLVPVDQALIVQRVVDRREKYGRWLVLVWARDGACLNVDLLASGHATPWDGVGPRPAGALAQLAQGKAKEDERRG